MLEQPELVQVQAQGLAQGLAQAKGLELARGFLALAAEHNFVALAEGLV